MIGTVLLLAAAGCGDRAPLTLEQAERLVLTAPNIEASARERGARPSFDWIRSGDSGWQFDVNSHTPCDHARACSTLLGHYIVNKYSGAVVDLDAGEDGREVSSPEMLALKRSFIEK